MKPTSRSFIATWAETAGRRHRNREAACPTPRRPPYQRAAIVSALKRRGAVILSTLQTAGRAGPSGSTRFQRAAACAAPGGGASLTSRKPTCDIGLYGSAPRRALGRYDRQ